MKKCTKCGIEKSLDEFNKDKNKKFGVSSNCKICVKKRVVEWRESNKERYREYRREYSNLNREKINDYKKNHRHSNRDLYIEKYNDNKEQIRIKYREWWKNKYYSDELFRFKNNTRNLISRSFKRSRAVEPRKCYRTEELLGCSIIDFRDHIKSLFTEGMTFDNYGEWHFDHIIPISSAKTQEDVERLCHFTNFQPLWAIDNLRKSNK